MFPVFWRTRRPLVAPTRPPPALPSSEPPVVDLRASSEDPAPETSVNSPVSPSCRGGVSVPSGNHRGTPDVVRENSRASSLGEDEGGVAATGEDNRGMCWVSSVGSVPSISGLDSNASSPPMSHGHSEPDADSNESPSDTEEPAVDQLRSGSPARQGEAEQAGYVRAFGSPFPPSTSQGDGFCSSPHPHPRIEGPCPTVETLAAFSGSSGRVRLRASLLHPATQDISNVTSHSVSVSFHSDECMRVPEAGQARQKASHVTLSPSLGTTPSSSEGGDFCVVERSVGGTGSAAWVASGEGARVSPSDSSSLRPCSHHPVTPQGEPLVSSLARSSSRGVGNRRPYLSTPEESSQRHCLHSGMGDSGYVVEPPATHSQLRPDSRGAREGGFRFFPLPKQSLSEPSASFSGREVERPDSQDDRHSNTGNEGTGAHASWVPHSSPANRELLRSGVEEHGEETVNGSWQALSPTRTEEEGYSEPRFSEEELTRTYPRRHTGELDLAGPETERVWTAGNRALYGEAIPDLSLRSSSEQAQDRHSNEDTVRQKREEAGTVAREQGCQDARLLSGSGHAIRQRNTAGHGLTQMLASHSAPPCFLSPSSSADTDEDEGLQRRASLSSVRDKHPSNLATGSQGHATGLVQTAVLLWEERLQQQAENSPRREPGTPRDASRFGSPSSLCEVSRRGRSMSSAGSHSPRNVREVAVGTSDDANSAGSVCTTQTDVKPPDPKGHNLHPTPHAVPPTVATTASTNPSFSRWGAQAGVLGPHPLFVGTECRPASVLQLLLSREIGSLPQVNRLAGPLAEAEAGASGRSAGGGTLVTSDKSEVCPVIQPGLRGFVPDGVGRDGSSGQMTEPFSSGSRPAIGLMGPTRGLYCGEPVARNIALNDFSSVSTILSEVQECESNREDGNGATNRSIRTTLLRQVQVKLEKQCKRRFLGKTHRFNILLTGEGQSGKTTLLNEMFSNWHRVSSRSVCCGEEVVFQLGECRPLFEVAVTEASHELLAIPYCELKLLDYLDRKKQLGQCIDDRIHVVLWLLRPCEGALSPQRLLILRRLRKLCCVFPILAMSDTVDVSHLGRYRERLHVELTGAGISPPHEWLFGEGAAAAPSASVKFTFQTPVNGNCPSPGHLLRPASQATQINVQVCGTEPVSSTAYPHLETRDIKSTCVDPILQLPWVGTHPAVDERTVSLGASLPTGGNRHLHQTVGAAEPSDAGARGERHREACEEHECVCEASNCQLSHDIRHDETRDEERNSGEHSQTHSDRRQQSSDGGSGGSDDSHEKNPVASSETVGAPVMNAQNSPLSFPCSAVAANETLELDTREGMKTLAETQIGCSGCTPAERQNRLCPRGRGSGMPVPAGKVSSTKDSDSLRSRGSSRNTPAESPCFRQGTLSPVQPVVVLEPSYSRPFVQAGSAVSSLESLGASSGWVASVHRSALAFPLLLDCGSSFVQQDSRYGYPRFEGVPPSSPAFLRLLLVEGSALLLLDVAKEKCFSPFYKLFWSREEAQQLNKKNSLAAWQQHQAPALHRLDQLRLLLTEMHRRALRQGVVTHMVGGQPGCRRLERSSEPEEGDRSRTESGGASEAPRGAGREGDETGENGDSLDPEGGSSNARIVKAVGEKKLFQQASDFSEQKLMQQEIRQIEMQIRRIQQQIELVQRDQREKQAKVLQRQLERQHEDTGLTWPDEEETTRAGKEPNRRRDDGELGGVVLQVTQMGLVSAVMVGVGALIFSSIKKGA
ncbi:UNVERIFIED_CONTAM: hypothetical protein HHA_309770 [Hammondia hammondi]|eukprot:XP_008886500.1 hypothetical protein HHA_309770 [Hammondia hammondi]